MIAVSKFSDLQEIKIFSISLFLTKGLKDLISLTVPIILVSIFLSHQSLMIF
jgi:hypothetical protein